MNDRMILGIETLEPRRHLSATLIKDLDPNSLTSIQESVAFNGQLYFEVGYTDSQSAPTPGLWKTDGTAAGTKLLRAGGFYGLTVVHGELWMREDDHVYRLDTADQLHDVATVGLSSWDPKFRKFGDKTIFTSAPLNSNSNELFISGGTPQTTFDIGPGLNETSIVVGKYLYYTTGQGLVRSDGTAAGTALVPGMPGGAAFAPLDQLNGKILYFATIGDQFGLCSSDGTAQGTTFLHRFDLYADGTTSMVVWNNRVYFAADGYDRANTELWMSDGTAAGTKLLKDIDPTGASSPQQLTVWHDALYFIARDNFIDPWQLYKSDGTTAGTAPITSFANDQNGGAVGARPLVASDSTLYFVASDPAGGAEPWQTNGDAASVQRTEDVWPGIYASDPRLLTVSANRLYFYATEPQHYDELWTSAPPSGSSIAGVVFNDANGNANRDPGEGGVANLAIYNDANNNGKLDADERKTQSDFAGSYRFSGLPAGNYKIRQLLPAGWAQTTPANNYGWTITLGANQALASRNFGAHSQPISGSIAGTVYNDVNNNGKRDAGEAGLAGITIYNDANNNSKLDAAEKTTVTGSDGLYQFTGLTAGAYKIRQILQGGWVQTTPSNNYGWTINLATNQQLIGKDFGTRQAAIAGGKISGMIFNDLDGDGKKDTNEAGVGSSWTVYIDLDNDSILDSNEVRTTTDANGNWMLSGLAAGTYKVRQVLQTGWKQTTPTNNYGLNITLSTNQSVSGKLFGSKKIA